MSKTKYSSIFSRQMAAVVFTIFKYSSPHMQFRNPDNITQTFPSFSWGMTSHVTRLHQSSVTLYN